jgi:tryptophan halogenase
MKINILGGGTAGLISAIVLKSKLPKFDISIIESSAKGIIGVGEGSTEHWRVFCEESSIDVDELVSECLATHKYGIRFENWTTHTPDYFHSIGFYEIINGSLPIYDYVNSMGKLLTNHLTNPCFIENKIQSNESVHKNTNQFHFDTFKLNEYLHKVAIGKGVAVYDDDITSVHLNPENGYIDNVSGRETYYGDFWIDASGFSRTLMKAIGKDEWISYAPFLLTDSAIPFPTAPDESGQIRPYTRAIGMRNGWMWEIPTQTRRGNGYVFSSSHISKDEAIKEIEDQTGFVLDNPRLISYSPGRLKSQWTKNCVPVGLSSAFVEPLEATSISTSIQQARLLSTFLPTYEKSHRASIKKYNDILNMFFENLLTMICLHYVSDRRDTEFWRDTAETERPALLEELLELWNERTPSQNDFPQTGYELFQVAHFWHVAQGQGLISKEASLRMLENQSNLDYSRNKIKELRSGFLAQKAVPHHEIF